MSNGTVANGRNDASRARRARQNLPRAAEHGITRRGEGARECYAEGRRPQTRGNCLPLSVQPVLELNPYNGSRMLLSPRTIAAARA